MDKNNPSMYEHFIDEYYLAYSIIKKEKPHPFDLFFTKAFLLGRMIELILKTELLLKDFKSDQLKQKNIGGHDLIKLLRLLNFPNDYLISPNIYLAIKHLNIYYSSKQYEYPESDDVEIRNISFLEDYIGLSINKLKFHLNERLKTQK